VGRVAAKLATVPVVVHTIHGFPFNDQTLAPRTRTALLWSERLAAHVTDRLVAVATPNVEEAARRGITGAEEIAVVHSGIDLRRLDVFACPILWGGVGRALTEAMIAGLPVVASAVNGVPEIVEHEQSGLLVEPGDAGLLAAGLIRLLRDTALAARLGAAARAT